MKSEVERRKSEVQKGNLQPGAFLNFPPPRSNLPLPSIVGHAGLVARCAGAGPCCGGIARMLSGSLPGCSGETTRFYARMATGVRLSVDEARGKFDLP